MSGFENDVMVAKNLNFDEAGAKPHLGIINAAGKFPIGTGLSQPSAEILAGSITSPNGSLTIGYSSPNITIQLPGGLPGITKITGDTGSFAIGPNINLFCNTNTETVNQGCGCTVAFSGDNISSMSLATHNTSTLDMIMGNRAGNNSLSGNSGNFNTGFGVLCLAALGGAGASQNCAFGIQTLQTLTNGGFNSGFGTDALRFITTGQNNQAFGMYAGNEYTSTETNNICIGTIGVIGDSNTIRIGGPQTNIGAVFGARTSCYIEGIASVSVSNAKFVTINTSTGQMGSSTATSGLFTWTDVTGATQTLAVNNGYLTDRGGGVTYTLPSTASIGDMIKIVGKLGLATITPNANQQILISSASGTVGVTGTAVSTNVGDCMTLVCTTSGASSVWRASDFVGNWTLS